MTHLTLFGPLIEVFGINHMALLCPNCQKMLNKRLIIVTFLIVGIKSYPKMRALLQCRNRWKPRIRNRRSPRYAFIVQNLKLKSEFNDIAFTDFSKLYFVAEIYSNLFSQNNC